MNPLDNIVSVEANFMGSIETNHLQLEDSTKVATTVNRL